VHDLAHGSITSGQLVLELQTQAPVPTDYAVVQIGINDLHPLARSARRSSRSSTGSGRTSCSSGDALLARSKVVVLTTLFRPVACPCRAASPGTRQPCNTCATSTKSYARPPTASAVILLDAHALLSDADSYLADRFVDSDFFLHVNGEAYSRLNERLRQLVLSASSSLVAE